MTLYIDKENLESLVRSEDKQAFQEYARLILKNLDVKYNFAKQEISGNELLGFWFRLLGDSVGGSHIFLASDEVVPPRPVKANFYKRLDSEGLSSMFFLDDKEKCVAVNAKHCLIISKPGDEVECLKSVFDLQNNGEVLSYQIPCWKSYLPELPLTDVILCDNHYFKSKEVYEANNNEILRVLSSIPQESPVNVVLIVKGAEVSPKFSLTEIQQEIKSLVKKASGSKDSTVTIVNTTQVHDRTLITNYYRVKHGSCFHLKGNNLKKDVTTEIKTHAIRLNHQATKSILSEYQKIITPANCIGDKVSNYLKF